MNPSLLADLQRREAYPSITVLANSTPRATLSPHERARIDELIADADRRLVGDVDDRLRTSLVDRLRRLLDEYAVQAGSRAVALCASPEHATVVRLGRDVTPRVVIDRTFATRDLVADLSRTASYYILTVSDHRARLLLGDRHRVVERHDDLWPLDRADDESPTLWKANVCNSIDHQRSIRSMPIVVAGVQRTATQLLDASGIEPIATVAGNHDRTTPAELHTLTWPAVVDWLRSDQARTRELLDRARSSRRFAGGIDEIWSLALDGRVELLAVEDGFALPARVEADRLVRVEDPEAPGVVDDVVDELIEHVMRAGGRAVMVPDGDLADHARIAAVLRY